MQRSQLDETPFIQQCFVKRTFIEFADNEAKSPSSRGRRPRAQTESTVVHEYEMSSSSEPSTRPPSDCEDPSPESTWNAPTRVRLGRNMDSSSGSEEAMPPLPCKYQSAPEFPAPAQHSMLMNDRTARGACALPVNSSRRQNFAGAQMGLQASAPVFVPAPTWHANGQDPTWGMPEPQWVPEVGAWWVPAPAPAHGPVVVPSRPCETRVVGGAAKTPTVPEGPLTTVMVRNLPTEFTRGMLVDLLDAEGFAGLYSFVYLPIDFNTKVGLGYCFVDMVSTEEAFRFWAHFDGFSRWGIASEKTAALHWSAPHQGLQAHIERYRNSPVMHESVPDECKPMIFANGVRVQFPKNTKSIKAPRVRCRTQN